MKKNKTITICASASFYKEVLEIEKKLKKMGFKVMVPITAKRMHKNKNFDVSSYKTWYANKADYKKKKKLMDGHFKKVIKADGILIVNNEKKGIKGYIGGNTLMEMTLAYYFKKKIFVLNQISEDLPIKEEIYGMFPVFLNGDITKIFS